MSAHDVRIEFMAEPFVEFFIFISLSVCPDIMFHQQESEHIILVN